MSSSGKWFELKHRHQTIRVEAKSYSFHSTTYLYRNPLIESTFIHLPKEIVNRFLLSVTKKLQVRIAKIIDDSNKEHNQLILSKSLLFHNVQYLQIIFQCVDNLLQLCLMVKRSNVERMHLYQDLCFQSDFPPFCSCRYVNTKKLQSLLAKAKLPTSTALCLQLKQPRPILLDCGKLIQNHIDYLKLKRKTLDVVLSIAQIPNFLEEIRQEKDDFMFEELTLRPMEYWLNLDHLKGPDERKTEKSATQLYEIEIVSNFAKILKLKQNDE
ncbi:unnamed protein product, partial [Mesorhabditis belari]|uniref:Uncharacterized protein n=1 Tax=Mesorhabditis belari TaxID=2138241 RepID=A0AAF3F6V4_9BILA